MNKYRYTEKEIKLFKKLNSPHKIQNYINSLHFNFDEKWSSCMSPRKVIEQKKADCIEGALLASAILEFHGYKPIILDLRSLKKPYDYDHVVAIFKSGKYFGAISKTNHAVLRYREPVYKNIREIVMSYFNEYFLGNGQKTLREYSVPVNMNYFNKINWRTTESSLSEVMTHLDKVRHIKILNSNQIKNLRKADKIEVLASSHTEYKKR